MEEQVANAIEIAWNPSSDQALKSQAFDYLNQLRSDPSGWQVCLSLFIKSPPQPEIVRHASLEIVNSAAQAGLIHLGSLVVVKDGLLSYLRQVYGPDATGVPDAPYIQNKIAQTVTFLFSALYANGWETCFDDLLGLTYKSSTSTTRDNPLGIVFYLRVVNSIHEEIGDVLVSRSRGEQDKANNLKDLIRERDMQKIASSWQEILSAWQDGEDVVVAMCLKAVGSWVSWIDIGLVVNQTMLDLLFQLLGRAKKQELRDGERRVRDAAVDVFTEIIGKKMKPADKIEMIDFLKLNLIVTELSNSPPLHQNRSTPDYDTDLAETVAKLVNITVLDIVRVLESDTGPVKEKAETLLQEFVPHMLRYFSDEYDEVCSTVVACVNDMLQYIRKLNKSNPSYYEPVNAELLRGFLTAIIAKTRYDETSDWGNEDEQTDEAEFLELRKGLGVLQHVIANSHEELYISVISQSVENTFSSVRATQGQIDWRDLELALHEMFLFGDLAVKGGGIYHKNAPAGPAAVKLIDMMNRMMECDIQFFTHPATQLQYMEICVRYSIFFQHHQHLIPVVLDSFLKLVHHPNRKVKTRSWYLFQRLVKQLRALIGNVAQTVVEALLKLLVIKAELPSEGDDGDGMSSEDHESSADAIFNSQLYLFEAVGIICSTHGVPADKQVLYAQTVLQPIFTDMEQAIQVAKTNDERAILQIHHDIMALGTFARGFSDWTPGSHTTANLPAPEVSEAFSQVAEATLVALESLKGSFNVRTASRFAFSRFIGVQGARILPQLPRWIDGLMTETSSRDEMALFLRLLDQVIFGFKSEIYSILDTLLTPFLQRVFAGIAEPTTGTDDEIQLAELKREYLNFLLAVLNNDLGAVIISERNQTLFETVVTSLEHFAKDIEDYTTAKMAFSVLSKMGLSWGGPDIAPAAANGTAPNRAALPGFGGFMITRFSPLCWALPANPSFNSKDAQAKQVLAEAGTLQRTIYQKTGMEYADYLRNNELPGMGMGSDLIEEFLTALTQLDLRNFRQFFPSFIQRLSG
ncbi:hypothetical protein N7532_006299 [Penicillium argentinense]|uniref:Exportin-T n=1 Tax=Penicillium argentinense TaxID=1131581 RepID=A0A9W9KAT2_9EURO|nr:uncharacterized protein N7532_006299 [Penicillium argentinense]KAJ5099298.1 hypothetical protein N7532_006299 [Penicillium argentinense]